MDKGPLSEGRNNPLGELGRSISNLPDHVPLLQRAFIKAPGQQMTLAEKQKFLDLYQQERVFENAVRFKTTVSKTPDETPVVCSDCGAHMNYKGVNLVEVARPQDLAIELDPQGEIKMTINNKVKDIYVPAIAEHALAIHSSAEGRTGQGVTNVDVQTISDYFPFSSATEERQSA